MVIILLLCFQVTTILVEMEIFSAQVILAVVALGKILCL